MTDTTVLQVEVANCAGVAHQLHRGSSKEGVQLYGGKGKFDSLALHSALLHCMRLKWYHTITVMLRASATNICCSGVQS